MQCGAVIRLYGGGVVERSVFSARKENADKWIDCLEGDLPEEKPFQIIMVLSKLPAGAGAHVKRICELTGLPNEKTMRELVEAMHKEGVLKVVRSRTRGAFIVSEYGLTEKGGS